MNFGFLTVFILGPSVIFAVGTGFIDRWCAADPEPCTLGSYEEDGLCQGYTYSIPGVLDDVLKHTSASTSPESVLSDPIRFNDFSPSMWRFVRGDITADVSFSRTGLESIFRQKDIPDASTEAATRSSPFPVDPCSILCALDSIRCTAGSYAKNGVCHGYIYLIPRSSGEFCYHTTATASVCPDSGDPVTIADVTSFLCGFRRIKSNLDNEAPASTPSSLPRSKRQVSGGNDVASSEEKFVSQAGCSVVRGAINEFEPDIPALSEMAAVRIPSTSAKADPLESTLCERRVFSGSEVPEITHFFDGSMHPVSGSGGDGENWDFSEGTDDRDALTSLHMEGPASAHGDPVMFWDVPQLIAMVKANPSTTLLDEKVATQVPPDPLKADQSAQKNREPENKVDSTIFPSFETGLDETSFRSTSSELFPAGSSEESRNIPHSFSHIETIVEKPGESSEITESMYVPTENLNCLTIRSSAETSIEGNQLQDFILTTGPQIRNLKSTSSVHSPYQSKDRINVERRAVSFSPLSANPVGISPIEERVDRDAAKDCGFDTSSTVTLNIGLRPFSEIFPGEVSDEEPYKFELTQALDPRLCYPYIHPGTDDGSECSAEFPIESFDGSEMNLEDHSDSDPTRASIAASSNRSSRATSSDDSLSGIDDIDSEFTGTEISYDSPTGFRLLLPETEFLDPYSQLTETDAETETDDGFEDDDSESLSGHIDADNDTSTESEIPETEFDDPKFEVSRQDDEEVSENSLSSHLDPDDDISSDMDDDTAAGTSEPATDEVDGNLSPIQEDSEDEENSEASTVNENDYSGDAEIRFEDIYPEYLGDHQSLGTARRFLPGSRPVRWDESIPGSVDELYQDDETGEETSSSLGQQNGRAVQFIKNPMQKSRKLRGTSQVAVTDDLISDMSETVTYDSGESNLDKEVQTELFSAVFVPTKSMFPDSRFEETDFHLDDVHVELNTKGAVYSKKVVSKQKSFGDASDDGSDLPEMFYMRPADTDSTEYNLNEDVDAEVVSGVLADTHFMSPYPCPQDAESQLNRSYVHSRKKGVASRTNSETKRASSVAFDEDDSFRHEMFYIGPPHVSYGVTDESEELDLHQDLDDRHILGAFVPTESMSPHACFEDTDRKLDDGNAFSEAKGGDGSSPGSVDELYQGDETGEETSSLGRQNGRAVGFIKNAVQKPGTLRGAGLVAGTGDVITDMSEQRRFVDAYEGDSDLPEMFYIRPAETFKTTVTNDSAEYNLNDDVDAEVVSGVLAHTHFMSPDLCREEADSQLNRSYAHSRKKRVASRTNSETKRTSSVAFDEDDSFRHEMFYIGPPHESDVVTDESEELDLHEDIHDKLISGAFVSSETMSLDRCFEDADLHLDEIKVLPRTSSVSRDPNSSFYQTDSTNPSSELDYPEIEQTDIYVQGTPDDELFGSLMERWMKINN